MRITRLIGGESASRLHVCTCVCVYGVYGVSLLQWRIQCVAFAKMYSECLWRLHFAHTRPCPREHNPTQTCSHTCRTHTYSHHTPTHGLVPARTNLHKHNAHTLYKYIHTVHQRTVLSAHTHTYTHMCTHTSTLHTPTQPCLCARKSTPKHMKTYSRGTHYHRYVAMQGHGQL